MHKSWLECEEIIKKYISGKELPKVIISQRRQMENNLQQGFFFKKIYISDTFSESTKYFLLKILVIFTEVSSSQQLRYPMTAHPKKEDIVHVSYFFRGIL
jgi:hypothetical protein